MFTATITDENQAYLTNVAKRAAFEMMDFSSLTAHPDTEVVVPVNVKNLAKGRDTPGSYTVRFEGTTAVNCACPADKYFNMCKHRVRTEQRLSNDVAAFLKERDADNDDRTRSRPNTVSRPDIDTPELLRQAKVLRWYNERGARVPRSKAAADAARANANADAGEGVPLTRREGTARTVGVERVI